MFSGFPLSKPIHPFYAHPHKMISTLALLLFCNVTPGFFFFLIRDSQNSSFATVVDLLVFSESLSSSNFSILGGSMKQIDKPCSYFAVREIDIYKLFTNLLADQ